MPRFLAAALMMLIGTGAAFAAESPWEPSKAGKIECFASNLEKKTCQTMTVYRWLDDTNVAAEGRGMSNLLPPGVVMVSQWKSRIEGNSSCFLLLESDVMKAKFEVDGMPVSAELTYQYRKQIVTAMPEAFGRTYCMRIGKYGREYTVQTTIDGREIPAASNWLAWIDKDSGFTLSP